jgi:hypothetical protein
MAAPKRRKSTASNKDAPVGEGREQALTAYLAWLEGRPLAARSREACAHQVRRYVTWLGDRLPVDGDPLVDEASRDWAVRDYKRHLKAVERWKPASVNLGAGPGDRGGAALHRAAPGGTRRSRCRRRADLGA